MNSRWIILMLGTVLAGAAQAAPGDKTDLVRDLAARVGPIIGSAFACQSIERPRVQTIADSIARPTSAENTPADRP